jgi:hypothetical protein
MQTYARQGGSSAIFVHDDGLQLISPKEREERITFYADHNIGWVARPKHDSAPGGFKRAGRFKKASNMNYGLALSLKLEKHLKVLEDAEDRGELDDSEYECLEDMALALAIEEVYNESGGKWQPWASNGKSLRIGEIILIVDADTIVPEVTNYLCLAERQMLIYISFVGLFPRCRTRACREPRRRYYPA